MEHHATNDDLAAKLDEITGVIRKAHKRQNLRIAISLSLSSAALVVSFVAMLLNR